MKVKKVLASLLALAMLLSLATMASAAEYADMPDEGHWSREAVQAAVDNGLFSGDSNGLLRPNDSISRAELAKVVVQAFGATAEGDITSFADVPAGAWYYSYVAKANKMGIMYGSNGTMRPTSPITRQEAFTILARALKLENGTADDLAAYSDASDVARWFVGPVSAMVKAGYVSGSGGKLDPAGNITRAQFAQVMHNIFATYISEGGTVTEVSAGNVIINAPDVMLRGCTIQGDLVIADGVGDGDVTLDNVKVSGRLVVRGGGVNSIHVINNSEISADVVVTKVDGNVRVYADATSGISVITVEDGKDNVIIEGTVGIVSVASSNTPVVLKNATVVSVEVTAADVNVTLESSKVNSVAVSADNATVELTGSTTVTSMAVEAVGVTVETEATTKITTIKADTDVTINGDGKVERTEGDGKVADAQGNEVETTPTTTPSTAEPERPAVHTHVWAAEWSRDEYNHWLTCIGGSGCTARANENPHNFNGGSCVCGQAAPVEDHECIWSEQGRDNGNGTHCFPCTVEGCTIAIDGGPHTLGSTPDDEGYFSCTVCTYKVKQGCENGHSISSWSINGDFHEGTCSRCGGSVSEWHIWDTSVTDGKVTCTAGCGATKNVNCDSTGHSWVDGQTTATCTDDGVLTQRCSYCGETREVPDPAKNPDQGHTWGETFKDLAADKFIHTCSVCGTTEETSEPEDFGN